MVLETNLTYGEEKVPNLISLSKEVKVCTIPTWLSFVLATIAPQMAVVFTNPFDTAKVRMQLQGQLKGSLHVYSNSWDCIKKIWRYEGIRALQKGLTPAIYREGFKNVFRIGMFDPILRTLHDKDKEKGGPPMWKRMVAGGISGAMGALSCNPFELIKTRSQAQSEHVKLSAQYRYHSMYAAFKTIVRREGWAGLYRGSSMDFMKRCFIDMSDSMASSFVTALVMNPIDVVRTRLYTQAIDPKTGIGLWYNGGLHAFIKIFIREGPFAFGKGFLTSFLRLGPHFTLTFVFLEQMRRMALGYAQKSADYFKVQQLREIFDVYDRDGNGKLDEAELLSLLKAALPRDRHQYLTESQYTQILTEDAKQLMKKLDVDHSGYIEFNEFMFITSNIERIVRNVALRSAFAFFDKDGNGVIDSNDLLEALKKIVPKQSRDQQLSEEEYLSLLRTDVNTIMEAIDSKHQGGIAFDEFEKVIAALPHVQSSRFI